MDNARSLLPFLVASVLSACSTSTSLPVDPGFVPATGVAGRSGVAAPVLPADSVLETCLAGGGALFELQAVNNNDTTDHGHVLGFAVSSDRRLAVAGEDGSVKFWSLSGFLGAAGGPALTYGPAIATPVAGDLAWAGDHVAVGDVSGLVTSYDVAGDANVVGGVDPGTAITAVATSADGARLAHADVRAGGQVTVRDMAGTNVVGPLASTIATVHDLAFLPDGTLLVAGGGAVGGTGPSLERWDATPGAPVQLVRYDGAGHDFIGVAASATGDVVAVASADHVVVLDSALHAGAFAAVDGSGTLGVDVGTTGRFVFTAGTDGVVRVLESHYAGETTRTSFTATPVALHVDPAGELLFVATSDSLVHAMACH